MNAAMFRTVLKLAAVAVFMLTAPALAQQRPAEPAQLSPTAPQPAPPELAPGTAAPAAGPSASAETASASKSVFAVPRELSPWSMFMSADVVVKAVMIGLAFASLVTWTIF